VMVKDRYHSGSANNADNVILVEHRWDIVESSTF
jgi:hypothetical protein